MLVLDEPTNDLDLATLRVLEEALVAFKGVVVVVSHDRYFLNRVCTSILAFEGAGEMFYDVGNYDDYLARRAARQQQEKAVAAGWAAPKEKDKSAATTAAKRARKLSFKEGAELAGIEARILAAEGEVARLEATLAAPDFYKEHAARWAEFEKQLATARAGVTRLYVRWEELEAIRAAAAD